MWLEITFTINCFWAVVQISVLEMRWDEMRWYEKWDETRWISCKWNEMATEMMRRHEIVCSEMRCRMIWDVWWCAAFIPLKYVLFLYLIYFILNKEKDIVYNINTHIIRSILRLYIDNIILSYPNNFIHCSCRVYQY